MRRSDDVHCRIAEHTAEIPRHIRSDDVSAADVMHVVLVHGVIGMYHGNPLCGGNQLAKEAEGELRLRMDNVKVHAVDLFQHMRRTDVAGAVIAHEKDRNAGQAENIGFVFVPAAGVGRREDIYMVSAFLQRGGKCAD